MILNFSIKRNLFSSTAFMINFSCIKNKLSTFFLLRKYSTRFEHSPASISRNNLIIDFIGPPGVGKTAYTNYLINKFDTATKFITSNNLKKLMSTNLSAQIVYKPFHSTLLNDFFFYIEQSNETAKGKIDKTLLALSEIKCDCLSASFNGIVVNDEGLSHHFTELIYNNISKNSDSIFLEEYLKNRMVVFLDVSPKVLIKRVKNRIEYNNHIWEGHKGLTSKEIIDLTEKDLKIKRNLSREILKSHNSSILIIDSEKEITENIERIINHINELKNQNFIKK